VGQSGLESRVTEWNKRVKIKSRSSFLLSNEDKVSPEISTPSSECSEPYLWSMLDGRTPEVEVLEFMHSLVRVYKPNLILQTSTWLGHASCSIGAALRQNGRGILVTFEDDKECNDVAQKRISRQGLEKEVDLRNQSSLSYHPPGKIDFLLLGPHIGSVDIQIEEFHHYKSYLQPGSVVVFYNSAPQFDANKRQIEKLRKKNSLEGLYLPTPRGVGIFQLRQSTSLLGFLGRR
jgi:predicted O-methyltransferase YrrM